MLGVCCPLPVNIHSLCLLQNESFTAVQGPAFWLTFSPSPWVKPIVLLGQPKSGDQVDRTWGQCWGPVWIPGQGDLHHHSLALVCNAGSLILWYRAGGCWWHLCPPEVRRDLVFWLPLFGGRRWLVTSEKTEPLPPDTSWSNNTHPRLQIPLSYFSVRDRVTL